MLLGQHQLLNWNIDDGQPPNGTKVLFSLNNKKGGDIDEFPEDLQVREFPGGVF
jgi:hypothetical protein